MAGSTRKAPLVLPWRDRSGTARPDMKTRHLALLVFGALAAGMGSVWALLGERPPLGAASIGPWESFPRMGASDVDPYGRAILARGPHLPLAAGEGVQFSARVDNAGDALSSACDYRLTGATLPSRGWTMTVADRGGRALLANQAAAISDADIVTDEGGRVTVSLSARVQPGVWLQTPDRGRYTLILRFYDTPASASVAQLNKAALPAIERLGCP
ncbi:MAG: DUF1214 domain-containing protein [Bosea sp.]|jgi:hypothetical protein|nr:DUF1214 domain-containing protein [Bosea sp. (in: a-proteobacteria)]